jgi:hypothetical protein
MRIRKADKHIQTSLRGIAKRAWEYPMLLYEASSVEEPCTGKPSAGICERGAGKPVNPISMAKKKFKKDNLPTTYILNIRRF